MIRKFSASDTDAIMNIWFKSNITVHSFVPEKYWRENYAYVKQAIPEAEVYVYTDDKSNEIIAFIGLTDNYIDGLFVKENSRSKGLGKALLDYVKSIKFELTLEVYEKNARAIGFYKREGFSVQRHSVDEDTNEKEYIMIWRKI